ANTARNVARNARVWNALETPRPRACWLSGDSRLARVGGGTHELQGWVKSRFASRAYSRQRTMQSACQRHHREGLKGSWCGSSFRSELLRPDSRHASAIWYRSTGSGGNFVADDVTGNRQGPTRANENVAGGIYREPAFAIIEPVCGCLKRKILQN